MDISCLHLVMTIHCILNHDVILCTRNHDDKLFIMNIMMTHLEFNLDVVLYCRHNHDNEL